MSVNRCERCNGSGSVMGAGMIFDDCVKCDGTGLFSIRERTDKNIVDKRSKSYKEAINNIMELDPSITKEEASKMFEEAYNKIEKDN